MSQSARTVPVIGVRDGIGGELTRTPVNRGELASLIAVVLHDEPSWITGPAGDMDGSLTTLRTRLRAS